MKRLRVDFSTEAWEQSEAVRAWWKANRPAAPELFGQELAAALDRLRLLPGSGSAYDKSAVAGMRRLLMPRTRHHVYYTVSDDDSTVRVHAIWHASRKHGALL